MVKGTLFSRKTALDGVGAMKSFGGCGREVVEGEKKGGDVTDPDGPKWTAWSVARCRDRGLGETGGWVAI